MKCFSNSAGFNVYLNFTCGNHHPRVYQIGIIECETFFYYECYYQCQVRWRTSISTCYRGNRSISVSPLLGFDIVFEVYHQCCNENDVSSPPCRNPFIFKMSDDCISCGNAPYCIYHVDLKNSRVWSNDNRLLNLEAKKNW